MSNSVITDPQFYVFNSLIGEWNLSRIISNTATTNGVAEFKARKQDQLDYVEHCTVRMHTGQSFSAYQEYLYQLRDDEITVFALNSHSQTVMHRLFFTYEYPFLKATSRYSCNSDSYDAIFLFQYNQLRLIYQVKGPNKNYLIQTHLQRRTI